MSDNKKSLKEILAERKALNSAQEPNRAIETLKTQEVLEDVEEVAIPEKPLSLVEILANNRRKLEAIKKAVHDKNFDNTLKTIVQPELQDFAKKTVTQCVAEALEAEEASEVEEDDGTFSLNVVLNDKQILARDLALAGKSFAFIGAAGTGKTTALREVARALLQSSLLRTHTFRIQGTTSKIESSSLAIIAWTRIASGNARKAICKDPVLADQLYHNVTTAHNLLEFYPEFFFDDVTGKDSMRFVPKRTAYNKLDITHLIIEEASLIDIPMWKMLFAAMREDVQIIFVGDINQLPPVFGPSILNYALTQLPTVELTEVYRQQGESLVLENAHRILEGRELLEGDDFKIIRCGTVQHSQSKLAMSLGVTFPKWMDAGEYDPETDIILSPWNVKDLGTDNINKWIAQRLGTDRQAVVHQVIAGRNTHYLAVGDKVLYNKQVAYIKNINLNAMYMGKAPLTASNALNRFGTYTGVHQASDDFHLEGYENLDIDKILDENIDVTKQCSHVIDIETDEGVGYCLEAIGDFAPSAFSLGYALTGHKSQGCEWRKVFIVMHKDHSINLSREWLYTTVTRAREQCVIIAKEHLINAVIKRQRLKGNTLAEKIEYFNAGLLNKDDVTCSK